MKKAKQAKVPDYNALTNQQAGIAKQNWLTNVGVARPNQVGIGGTNTWERNGEDWTNTLALSPERQELYDLTQDKAQEQLSGYNTGQINLDGAPDMPTVGGGPNMDIYNAITGLNQTGLDDASAARQQRQAAMGLGGAERIVQNSERNEADAATRMRMAALMPAYAQTNTEFGQGMDVRQQGVNETFRTEQANQAKMGGMMGQANNFTMPTFSGVTTPGMPGAVNPDLTGAANSMYQGQQARYNADAASNPWNQLVGFAGNNIGAGLKAYTGGMMGDPQAGSKMAGGSSGWDFGPAQTDRSGFNW